MIINKNDDFVNLRCMRLYEFHLFLPTSARSPNFADARDVTRQLVFTETQWCSRSSGGFLSIQRWTNPIDKCINLFGSAGDIWRSF